tara:strand:- start:306 stop:455 length:150 start_codon:yes stop_codon:yes gene_type:complete
MARKVSAPSPPVVEVRDLLKKLNLLERRDLLKKLNLLKRSDFFRDVAPV